MYNQKYFSLIVFSFMFSAQILLSQIVFQGTVSDNGSEYLGSCADPVAGALVTITDQADAGRTFSGYTDQQGHYLIEIIQTTVGSDPGVRPSSFRLFQNYPNPFNPSTVIGYELSQPARIVIEIYNVKGQKVRTLINGFQNASGHVTWDGTNDIGQGVPAGLFIYSLKSGGKRVNRKMILIDGHQGRGSTSLSPSFSQQHADNTVLPKQQSNQYTLNVTGDNLATYEQQNLEITGNMTKDITVNRIVTDIDGNVYRTVKIGDQWWFAENLKVIHYCNGEDIPNVTNSTEWEGLSTGAYCVYDNDVNNADTYGYLYNWYAVDDSRNIAPTGWHIPSADEWATLADYLGGADVAGGKLKETGTTHWTNPNEAATNESGFTALPGGYRASTTGSFYNLGNRGYWWSSNSYFDPIFNTNNALIRYIFYNNSTLIAYNQRQEYGYSVRCLKDN